MCVKPLDSSAGESGEFPIRLAPEEVLILDLEILDLSGEGNYMFKQSSQIPMKFGGQFLILAVVCLLLAAGSATAQYKGYKTVITSERKHP